MYALWFLQDCLMWWLARGLHRNNLWVGHLALPIETGLLLWAFSLWQSGDIARMAFRIAIPLYGLAWLVLQLTAERLDHFSNYASPLSSLLIVCVAAYTVVTASLGSTEPVWRQDWLWIGSAMLLDSGSGVVLMPLGNLLFTSHSALRVLYQLYGSVDVVANLLVTGGMLCPRSHPASGGSSWPRLSWRASSSPRS